MMKLLDTMDKSSKSRENKEPGFKHLEAHRKKIDLERFGCTTIHHGG
jgi:hypothetical protein